MVNDGPCVARFLSFTIASQKTSIEFIETPQRVDELLPTLYDMVSDGLIEVQDTNIVKAAAMDQQTPEATTQPHERVAGTARLMRIFLGEADRPQEEPLYEAIVKELRRDGYLGSHGIPRNSGRWRKRTHAQREIFPSFEGFLPIMISVIDLGIGVQPSSADSKAREKPRKSTVATYSAITSP